jgi:NAD(P)-dependent dehydrogenase (short-subunit alcohol dehydrogenase family)
VAAKPTRPEQGLFWITGASSGIGRFVALEAVRRGWRVVATARRADELEALRRECVVANAIIPAACDVTDEAGMAAVVERIEAEHGPIARVFLNAGLYLPVKAVPFESSKYHKSFAVNLGGVVNGLAAVMPRMFARGFGQIAINASVAGYSGLPTSAAYGATKAGLINMAESLRFDCDPANIHLQVVNPGFVETPATAKNDFPMPFLMPVEEAAKRVLDGMASPRFEITFPRRFALILKVLRILPRGLYFAIVGRGTKG